MCLEFKNATFQTIINLRHFNTPLVLKKIEEILFTISETIINDVSDFVKPIELTLECKANLSFICIILGTGISRKENFQMCLSLSFHNYKIVFKVRISSPLQTYLVDGFNRKETRPRRPRIQFENFPGETFPCKTSLCHYINIAYNFKYTLGFKCFLTCIIARIKYCKKNKI